MGLLNMFFTAPDDAAAQALCGDDGPAIGVDLGGVTQVELDTLLSSITGQSYDEVVAEPLTYLFPPPDEQWLFEMRPGLVHALAGLSRSDLPAVAQRWAATEEMAGTPPDALVPGIEQLVELARTTVSSGQRMYLWGSL